MNNAIRAQAKFMRRQIARAWAFAEECYARNDPTSALTFELWANREEAELETTDHQPPRSSRRIHESR